MTDEFAGVVKALSEWYDVERKVGQGGAAAVFLVRDREIDRSLAIKVLLPDVASVVSVDRFLREIQTAARLVHPHIVPVFDSGRVMDLPYYVMPFIDGETLRLRIARERRLAVGDAVRIASEIADALDYAHAVGVVHRDIKPENILMASGHAVVADFGIAKAITAASRRSTPGEAKITDTNLVVGTAAYMSPEQATGDPRLDGRSDIYSLGLVLYEMLVGTPPFTAATAEASIALRFVEDPPLLRRVRPDTSEAVERAVARALQRDPNERYQSAREFAEALEESRGPARVPETARDSIPSIAVLPFRTLSNDPEDRIFSDSMTEDIINALTRLRRLRVVARASSFSIPPNQDVRETGRKLNVGYVLEGSVGRSQKQIRIKTNLINTSDGFSVWAEPFDRAHGEMFAMQDDIAQAIVSTLLQPLFGAPTRTDPDAEAYKLYQRGVHFSNRHTPESFAQAGEAFAKAIEVDPNLAIAHAGQADLFAFLGMYGFLAASETMPRARDAALRAISLDPAAAEPHASLGTVRALYEWDWAGATAEFKRAISINPSVSTAYTRYANYVLLPLGRFDDAIAELRRALAFDALSPWINMSIGMIHFYARRFDVAAAELRSVIELDPGFMLGHFFLGRTLVETGRIAEGIESLKRSHSLSGGNPWATAEIGYAHARAGDRSAAESALNMLKAQSTQQFVSSCYTATVHVALGNLDEAMRGFERGFQEHSHDLPWLGVHPGLDEMRKDPRFTDLLGRIGLVA